MISNEHQRFGSADVSSLADCRRAGMFQRAEDGVFHGFFAGKPLFFSGMGGTCLIAGARTQKLTSVLAYTLCGVGYVGNLLALDPKGELAAISQNQSHTGKHTTFWNPLGVHGLPQDRINPLAHIRHDDASIITKLLQTCETALPLSGSPTGKFFERTSRKFAGGIAVVCAERDGELTFPSWVAAITLLISGGDAWLDFAYLMSISEHAIAREAEAEIAQGRASGATWFEGVLAELAQAFQVFTDPVLMKALSPPFDFSYEELLSEAERFNVYLIVPADFISQWSLVLKMHFTCARIFKGENPSGPRQLWMIDEAGLLGANPMLEQMFVFGAGIGIKPIAVFQSLKQLDEVGKNARGIILSSAAVRQFFGVRDLETARYVSAMCGDQHLSFDDERLQAQAAHRKREAALSILNGGNILESALKYRHEAAQEVQRSSIKRPLRTPDEILNTPPGKQYIFCDHIQKLIYCDRKPYFEQHWMAGRYHPNPYHPPIEKVRIKNRFFGHSWRRVLKKDPPKHLRHLRQYQTRPLSYIEGFEP